MSEPSELEFLVGDDRLRATQLGARVDLLAFHGIGKNANRNGILYLLSSLVDLGYVTVSLDFPGHGESPGDEQHSTLADRVRQGCGVALAVRPRALLGVSMGAFVACSIVPDVQPAALVLICPALYPASALHMPFDRSFPSVLAQGDCFRGSPALNYIRGFTGSLLIIGGTADDITPPESFQLLHDAATNARSRDIVWLQDCGHAVHSHLRSTETHREAVLSAIDRTLSDSRPF